MPDDLDVIMNSYSVFLTSRSSEIRQLESLSDLFDGDQNHRNMSDVLSKLRDVHQKKLDVLFKDVCMLARIYLACPSQVLNARDRSACCVGWKRDFDAQQASIGWITSSFLWHILQDHAVDLVCMTEDFVRLNDQRKEDFGL